MTSTHKKVIVRKMDRDTMNGYVASANFIVEGKLEMLNTAGNVVGIELSENGSPVRKTFANRPRTEGLWVRLKFKDNDVVEGMMPNDLTQTQAEGFLINPPDTRANTQRIFVPRSALSSLTVLGVIGGTKGGRRRAVPAEVGQVRLFEQ